MFPRRRTKAVFLCCLALLAARAAGAGLPGGDWHLHTQRANATLGRNGDALRIDVQRPSDPFYLTQATQTLKAALPAGHQVRMSFQARAAAGNAMRALLEQNGAPYFAVLEISPTLGPEWKTFRALGVTGRDWPEGSLSVRFQVGHQAGVIELRDIQIEDAGPDPRVEAAKAALAPQRIEERIRKHRMADLEVEVRDAEGKPAPGAAVRVEQQRHSFLFGCNIFGLRPDDSSPAQRAYQEQFAALLNFATLPFYWGAFEPARGRPQYEKLDKMARWCQARGIACKGHPLVWHDVWPAWAPEEIDAAIPLLRARVFDIIPRYRETIRFWDVLNEANSAAHYPKTGEGLWIRRDGPAPVVATALGWAREACGQSAATLLYNDFKTGAENEDLLRALRDRNALPDAVGIQSHMHDATWPLPQAWDVVERFAAFGRPVHFTEMTIVSGPKPGHAPDRDPVPGWESTPEGEAAQARYVAELYTVLFSHPAMQAITWWDFSDLHAWKGAPAGLVRKDMTPKPAYNELIGLIRTKWWTRDGAVADARGAASVRVFRGTHAVTATDAAGRTVSQTVEVPADCAAKKITLTVPRVR